MSGFSKLDQINFSYLTFVKLSLLALTVILLNSCGGGGGSTTSINNTETSQDIETVETGKSSGVAQKGPFIVDSEVSIHRLDSTAVETGEIVNTAVDSINGGFTFDRPNGQVSEDSYNLISVNGYYFDEANGFITPKTSILTSITDNINNNSINIFTHWRAARVKKLIESEKYDVRDAIESANTELTQQFGITNPGKLDFTQPSSVYSSENAMLLLVSGNLTKVAWDYDFDSSEIISLIKEDFATDGKVNDKGEIWLDLMQAMVRGDPEIQLNTFSSSLAEGLGLKTVSSKSLPDYIPLASRPVAIISSEIFAEPSEIVVLDGSESHGDGSIINYTWFRIDQKTQFNIQFSDRFAANPSIKVPVEETTLLFALVITDEFQMTDTAIVKVIIKKPPPLNNPPVAENDTVFTDEDIPVDITLKASDLDNDALNYVITTPLVLPNGLLTGDAPNLLYTPTNNYFGEDSFIFYVDDGFTTSEAARIDIQISPVDDPPTAQGLALKYTPQQSLSIQLIGNDPDGSNSNLVYTILSQPSNGTLSAIQGDTLIFTPSAQSSMGEFTYKVTDENSLDSNSATVSLEPVDLANTPPVANAGADQDANVNETIFLDGTGSNDADADTLIFSWVFVSKPSTSSAVLLNDSSTNPSLIIDAKGIYEIELTVNDGSESSTDSVIVSVLNRPPVADAGTAQTANINDEVTLFGNGSSDLDGDTLTFNWIFLNKPAGSSASINGATLVNPKFDVDKAGTYEFQLTVFDGEASATDTVTVTVINIPPVADAGPDQNAQVGDTITLDGTGSSDQDGDTLTYSWVFISTSVISLKPSPRAKPTSSSSTLTSSDTANPTFEIDVAGDYEIELTVSDGIETSTDTVIVSTLNTAPVADAGSDQTVKVTELVTLDGSASTDVDGDALSYSWSLTSPSNSNATLVAATTSSPTFTIDLPGEYIATLVVNDGTADSLPVSVKISTSNSIPVADAGSDQTVKVTEDVTLDG